MRTGGEGSDREWNGWDCITNSVGMSLSKLWKIVKDRESWHDAVQKVKFNLATEQQMKKYKCIEGVTKFFLKWINMSEWMDETMNE